MLISSLFPFHPHQKNKKRERDVPSLIYAHQLLTLKGENHKHRPLYFIDKRNQFRCPCELGKSPSSTFRVHEKPSHIYIYIYIYIY
jgi:hypothetical protein